MHVLAFKQEVDHLLFQQLAVLDVHHVEFLLVNQHGLLVLPLCPCFFRNLVINAFSQIAWVQLKILTFCFTLQESTKNRSAHKKSSLSTGTLNLRTDA
ncbi:hypothetical protein D3C73_1357530 [compost metagenome]